MHRDYEDTLMEVFRNTFVDWKFALSGPLYCWQVVEQDSYHKVYWLVGCARCYTNI